MKPSYIGPSVLKFTHFTQHESDAPENPHMKIRPVRDAISTALALAPMASGLPPLGLLGTAFKKAFISEESSFSQRFWVGFAATIASAGAGLIPYLIATPGREAKKDVQQTRASIASARYGE